MTHNRDGTPGDPNETEHQDVSHADLADDVSGTRASGIDAASDVSAGAPSYEPWRRRPTIRQIKEKWQQLEDYHEKSDKWENERSRLPANETVHLGGVLLTEAFTPSTVSNLSATLAAWPSTPFNQPEELVTRLQLSRGGVGGGGWQSLGEVRRAGELLVDGHHDPTLPDSVDSVWLSLHFLVPSVAVVCGTFTFKENAADLSDLLRKDYSTSEGDILLSVLGPLGALRARIPWSRPKQYATSSNVIRPFEAKSQACAELVWKREQECRKWFHAKFRGAFAEQPAERQPVIKVYWLFKLKRGCREARVVAR